MATGGTSFDDSEEQELHNWANGSLEDRLNNMDWGVQQKKANRSSEKNRKKFSAAVAESRLTNDISPESTPGAGRRRARTPHSFPHVKYTTQMSVPEQAELERLRQRINFTDLDERSVGSDSQGRVTAANNQRQLPGENKKPYNFLPLHVNTNKSRDLLAASGSASTLATPASSKQAKKQSPGFRDSFGPLFPIIEPLPGLLDSAAAEQSPLAHRQYERGESCVDSSQVVGKLVQIREYIGKASSMRDDLLEKKDVPANVERLSQLIQHLKEQEKSYLRFLQKMLARENEQDDAGTLDSAVGSGSLAESTSLNMESGSGPVPAQGDQKEELENLRKQHELLKKMLEQQEQLRALQGRQAALLAMQHTAEQAIAVMDDTETTGSVSGVSITSELNDELNDLISRFHNQLHDSQVKAVPDNRRQAESLSLSREVCRSRAPKPATGPPKHRPLLHSASGPHAGLASGAATAPKLTVFQELQDKKQTMDKILQELHSLRDQTLNNNSCPRMSTQRSLSMGSSTDYVSALCTNAASTSFQPPIPQHHDASTSTDKLRKLKEVHKRLNELRELVQYYEQTSDMMVDTVNENVKEDEDEEEEDGTEDGSLFDAMSDSEQENRRLIANISGNWSDLNTLTGNVRGVQGSGGANNRDGRLNTACEINNRSAANLRSLNIPSAIECQYNQAKDDSEEDEDEEEGGLGQGAGAQAAGVESEVSGSSRRSSLGGGTEFAQKVHRLQSAKQKLSQLQELVAMVQSDDTDGTTANEDEAPHQQPNNTRDHVVFRTGASKNTVLSEREREKLYDEKLRQQQLELKQLHDERQRLMDIQGMIQDLEWVCPDLQSSTSSIPSVQGLIKKLPAAASTPAPTKPKTSSGHHTNSSMLNAKAPEAANTAVADKELWTEMRRRQILKEELRERRKHLESLMAEQQRRSGHAHSPCRSDHQQALPLSRDERTMATWGGSTPCHLDEDYRSESAGAAGDNDEGGAESSSSSDVHIYPVNRNQRSFKNQGSNLKPPAAFSGVEVSGPITVRAKARANHTAPSPRQIKVANQSGSQAAGATRRQENLRWASELSVSEAPRAPPPPPPPAAPHLNHNLWQEQISQLQKQLDLSSNVYQTLLHDQQTQSYMLQGLLAGQYNALPNNLASPQLPLVMHQLNRGYTQLAWQHNHVQWLKQVLNDLLQQQQHTSSSSSTTSCPGAQQARAKSSSIHETSSFFPGSPSQFLLFPSTLHPPGAGFNLPGFNLNPLFPPVMVGSPQGAGASSSPLQPQPHPLLDPNTTAKTEYMSFPPPVQRSPVNSSKDSRSAGWVFDRAPPATNTVQHPSLHLAPPAHPEASPSPGNGDQRRRHRPPPREFDQESQESFSSLPDPVEPSTVTKPFRIGRKASTQASLASRDKTPNSKARCRRGKGLNKTTGDLESDSASSTSEFVQKRAPQPRQKDQNQSLLDKLTQEKLDSKSKPGNKPNDLSSAYAWRTPFLSNRIACTEAPGKHPRDPSFLVDASSDFSLFEALRETIYSEVATLISQNESRPHFLIELFHELQLLNTDYLRQRALYSLQDIVTRHLTEAGMSADQPSSLGPGAWATGSQSELTPSESMGTSEAESEKNVRVKQDSAKARGEGRSLDESTMSTSSNLEAFANDDLGNTVIHLDKALARMREYERMKLRAEFNHRYANSASAESSDASHAELASTASRPTQGGASGDVRCQQIDTQQLDRQIKAIMKEVIPFLTEHMEEVCSQELLWDLQHMVITLSQQNEENKEFVRFFHKQLGGILQDSLSKFVGRALKDCGEDLLVEISEILFNELAFFRLMQSLDNHSGIPITNLHKWTRAGQASETKHRPEEEKMSEGEKGFSLHYLDEDKDQDETEQDGGSVCQVTYLHAEEKEYSGSSEASEVEDQDDPESPLPLSISLSKAETQALTNYGSGEDENEEEEMDEFESGPVEVQTSLQAAAGLGEQPGAPANASQQAEPEHDGFDENDDQSGGSGGETSETGPSDGEDRTLLGNRDPEKGCGLETELETELEAEVETETELRAEVAAEAGVDADSHTRSSHQREDSKASSTSSSADTDSPVMVNADELGSGNTSQKSDEEDFVKVEELPLQLSVMCEEELQKRIVDEQQSNRLSSELVAGTEEITGLVGNAQALREPESSGAQSA
ncbi:pericentriolar material 1 protein isoform X2 [Gadus morhua]|uniref:pericentriolar material 1 protein isoform X2 n=1 Tax=Gadus morhua TaxID=8049 RepID=UPI0011B558C9|nr:pericentriolar material 1 protein isoform X2 [Gadus morhua]